jgi:hypothetical protein
MRMRTTAGGIALAAVLVIVADQSRTPAAAAPADGQFGSVGKVTRPGSTYGFQVTFLMTQDSKRMAHNSDDQITIVFANRTAEGKVAPQPLFGDDIVQEFSFSARDFQKDQLRFTRRVADKSFLDARYIRVVNHGADGWEGTTISLTVDGEQVLRSQPMSPRLGTAPTKGFQHFNREDWATRSYWEAELQRFRRPATAR